MLSEKQIRRNLERVEVYGRRGEQQPDGAPCPSGQRRTWNSDPIPEATPVSPIEKKDVVEP